LCPVKNREGIKINRCIFDYAFTQSSLTWLAFYLPNALAALDRR